MKPYNSIVSDEAVRQSGACVMFLADKDIAAAQRLRKRLIDGIRSLASMPERYPFFNEPYIPANKYHKMFLEPYYLILYQIRDQTVFVDYVIDGRQDYQWLVR